MLPVRWQECLFLNRLVHLYACPNPARGMEADKDYLADILHTKNLAEEPIPNDSY